MDESKVIKKLIELDGRLERIEVSMLKKKKPVKKSLLLWIKSLTVLTKNVFLPLSGLNVLKVTLRSSAGKLRK